MNTDDILLLWLKNKITALSRATGRELWATALPGGGMGHDFVTVVTANNLIFAHSKGRVHALEMETGRLLWTNTLPGLGYGLATLSIPDGMSSPSPAVIQLLLQQQNSGAAGSTGAAGAT